MIKYNEEYALSEKHYYNTSYEKKQIVIGNSLSSDMGHIERWQTILNGESKNTSPFTISRDGVIHKHYEPTYHSDFINIGHLDRNVIAITLENEGSLWKNEDKNCYINYIGDIYNRRAKVVNVKWRERLYWAPYNIKQINSLVKLCTELCVEYNIPLETVESNTVVPLIQDFKGIVFRSNYSKYYYDVTPAFDVPSFKNKIELI